jgi:antitoxin HicB
MVKNLADYLGLPYTRELIPEPEGGWFVRIKELPGCMSQGETPEEALEMIDDAMAGWLETALTHGQSIPEPREDDDYSGKFVVRVPRSMHRKLAEQAGEDGVSLNQWIVAALAEVLGANVSNKVKQASGDADQVEITELLRRIAQDAPLQRYQQLTRMVRDWAEANVYRADDDET